MSVFHYQKFYQLTLEDLIFDEFYGHLSPERQKVLDDELANNPEAVKRKEDMVAAFNDPEHAAMMARAKERLDKSCSTVEKLLASIKQKRWKKRMKRDYYFYDHSRFRNLYMKHEMMEIREEKAIQEGRIKTPTLVLLPSF